jgi:hypothetical protein
LSNTQTTLPSPTSQIDANPTDTIVPPKETTLLPTETNTPKSSATNTAIPTETPTKVPTINTVSLIEKIRTENDPVTLWSSKSPDGQLQIDVVAYECVPVENNLEMTLEQIELIHTEGSGVDLLNETLYNCGGLGAGGFEGLFWSPNSQYFYYSIRGIPDGLYCFPYYLDLFRVDITDGSDSLSNRGPVSPDGISLVRLGETELIIMNLDTGEEMKAPLPVENGFIKIAAWSLDGDQLIYIITPSECVPNETAYLILYNIEGGEHTLLETIEGNTLINITWDTPEEIRLQDIQRRDWAYDLETGELTLIQEN